MILYIRTDSDPAHIALDDTVHEWQAGRSLSNDLLFNITELLEQQGVTLEELTGVAVYQGPGSFTGLRIGITVANTLAYGLAIPIVCAQTSQWKDLASKRLAEGESDKQVLPHYGAEANITKPKK